MSQLTRSSRVKECKIVTCPKDLCHHVSKSTSLSRNQKSYVITCQRVQACHGTKRAMASRVREYKLVTEPKELCHHVSKSTSLSRNQKSYVIMCQRVRVCHKHTKRAKSSRVHVQEYMFVTCPTELSRNV